MKNVYLICNAHLDPMWLWEWEEGAAAAVSTFRSAVTFCEQYETFIFNHNEALLYKWIEEYEPSLFERIKVQVKLGRWNIIGGWYLQPDCLMPSGEGFVRQITEGNKYFKEKFGTEFKTAINFDSFGHTRGLVQIMEKCGYENYLICRPGKKEMPQTDNEFNWIGFDGSCIKTRRHYELYNSPLGGAAEKIEYTIKNIDEGDSLMILWGVGNHGGGPSKKDIEDINALKKRMVPEGINLLHSTPDEYFNAKKCAVVKEVDFSLKPCNTGCLSSMVRIKQKYRELENLLFSVEKMASAASCLNLLEYPSRELSEVVSDLLLLQFHDILPGSSISPVEQAGIRIAEHGIEILTRLRARCFFALAKNEEAVKDAYPVLVYNHHPYEIKTAVECEFQLADQNWTDTFTLMDVYDSTGKKLNAQIEKEYCNLNLDWRKRVAFEAVLKPMSMNSFICKPFTIKKEDRLKALPAVFEFSANGYKVKLDTSTGLIFSIEREGIELLNAPICLVIHEDTEDPWAMQEFQYKELGAKIGCFKLMDKNEAKEFSHIKAELEPVRIVEDGPLRICIEALFKFNKSFAVVKYAFYKNSANMDISINTIWCEKDRALKLHIPAAFDAHFRGETAYGVQKLAESGIEEDFQKWCSIGSDKNFIGVINYGTYAGSCKDNNLMLTLQRSPAYSGHPINDREILHQDRYTPRIDQGERNYSFKLCFGLKEEDISRLAQTENEKPYALSFFPQGSGKKHAPLISLEGKGILLTTLKKADDGNGYIARLFNSTDKTASCNLRIGCFNIDLTTKLSPYEIKTFRFSDNKIIDNNLKEELLRG